MNTAAYGAGDPVATAPGSDMAANRQNRER